MKLVHKTLLCAAICALSISLVACGKKSADGSASDGSAGPPGAAALTGTETQYIEVKGQGETRDAAVDDALAQAVLQVNGKRVGQGQARGAIKNYKILSEQEVERNIAERKDEVSVKEHADLSAQARGNYSSSGSAAVSGRASNGNSVQGSASSSSQGNYAESGSVSANHNTTVTASTSGKERVWMVKVGADVVKFKEGADASKPRIVVAVAKTTAKQYPMGDSALSAAEAGAQLQHSLSESVQQTNRFLVIDRSFDDQINGELDNATGPNANQNDIVKLGQRLTADVLVIPVIEYLEYKKSVRHLNLANKDLISYSGGFKGRVTVINVATGQLLMNESYAVDFPTTEPQIYGAGVDGKGIADKTLAGLADKFVHSLIIKMFPISIVSMDGTTVVLSQGGTAVSEGATYKVVKMGAEIKDPQTHQSLGRMEKPFGTVTIAKVQPTMSYGELAATQPLAAGEFKAGLLEIREAVNTPTPTKADAGKAATNAPAAPAAPNKASGHKPAKDSEDEFLK
jgi:Curli production assembly/transport component CsgG